jgi:hypothetical protein
MNNSPCSHFRHLKLFMLIMGLSPIGNESCIRSKSDNEHLNGKNDKRY